MAFAFRALVRGGQNSGYKQDRLLKNNVSGFLYLNNVGL